MNQIRESLWEIENYLNDQQKYDDDVFKTEYQLCNQSITELQKELQTISYELSREQQQLVELQNIFDEQLLKEKKEELLIYQQNIQLIEKESTISLSQITLELQECQELIQMFKNVRQQYEQKVFPQLATQQNSKILAEIQKDVKNQFKKLNKLINKQKYTQFVKIFLNAVNQFNENPNNYDKLLQLLGQIEISVDSNMQTIRQSEDLIKLQYNANQKQLQNNMDQVNSEIFELEQQLFSSSDKIHKLQDQIINNQQAIISKTLLLDDKSQNCNDIEQFYKELRDQRNEMINLTSQVISLAEMDIFRIKDYYIQNGQIR